MGRHSAGDADLDDELEEVAEPSTAVESGGRHARTDEPGPEDRADERAAAEAGESEEGEPAASEPGAGTAEAAEPEGGEAAPDVPLSEQTDTGPTDTAQTDTAQTDTEPIDLLAEIGGQSEPSHVDVDPSASHVPPSGAATDGTERSSAGDASVAPRAPSGTRGDLKLLRQSAALRVRCIGAVVATFLIYTVALIVIGRTDVYLLWVWIPTVLSGILVGSFLDMAHRRVAGPPDRPDDPARS